MIEVRPGTRDDDDLVYGSWMRTARRSMPCASMIDDDTYYSMRGQRGRIARVLARAPVGVAMWGDAIVGYGVGSGVTWHWWHVMPVFRGMGTVWRMFAALGVPREGLVVTTAHPFVAAVARRWCGDVRVDAWWLERDA